jgi:hypothetical protein
LARPMGVRPVATMTASGMGSSSKYCKVSGA